MRLTELFRNTAQVNTNTNATNVTQSASAQATTSQGRIANAAAQQILASLSPGDTVRGEIVSTDGGSVQIRLANNALIDAKLDGTVSGQSALSLGKLLNFEVRGNGQSLTLSPLFTNMASEGTASKALNMANLPVTAETMTMTTKLMEAGQPVDADSLTQVYREVTEHMDADMMDIIDLHTFGMEVTDENLTQIASYRNLTHQLTGGMSEVLNQLPGTMQEMLQSGNTEGAAQIAQTLLDLAAQLGDGAGEAAAGETVVGETVVGNAETVVSDTLNSLTEGLTGTAEGTSAANAADAANPAILTQAEGTQLWESLNESISQLTAGNEEYTALLDQLKQSLTSGQTGTAAQDLQALLAKAQTSGDQELLQVLLQNKTLTKVLEKSLTQQWTLTPEDVSDADKVDKLYQRLDSQLKTILHTLEQNGQGESTMAQSAQNMSSNLDFLQQLNMTYTYVQLPLRFQEGNAHGDLYVYTNKRNLAAKDGPVSALLHLDMEHLGPLDVYVTLDNSKVNTNFRVQDDETLDFLEAHMDLLTSRLQKRGYDCSTTMQVRGADEPTKSGLGGLEEKEAPKIIANYSFDVRA